MAFPFPSKDWVHLVEEIVEVELHFKAVGKAVATKTEGEFAKRDAKQMALVLPCQTPIRPKHKKPVCPAFDLKPAVSH